MNNRPGTVVHIILDALNEDDLWIIQVVKELEKCQVLILDGLYGERTARKYRIPVFDFFQNKSSDEKTARTHVCANEKSSTKSVGNERRG